MKKAIVPLLVGALAFSTVYFAHKAGQAPDPAAYVEKAKYDAAVKQGEQNIDAALAVVAQKEQAIAERDRKIAAILQSAGQPTQAEKAKDARIGELERRVAAFESQGDLRAALDASKAECREWSEKFSLAEKRHNGTIAALKAEFQAKSDDQDERFKAVMGALEQEKGLRLSCESLNKKLKPEKWRKWATYGGYALAFAVGNLAHR